MRNGKATEEFGKGLTGTDALARTRAGLEQVCRLLEMPSPEVLRGTAGLLESAVAALSGKQSQWQQGAARAEIEELHGIQQAVRRAGTLLRKAYEYHAGWGAYLGSRNRGYRAGGETAPWVPPRRFSLEG